MDTFKHNLDTLAGRRDERERILCYIDRLIKKCRDARTRTKHKQRKSNITAKLALLRQMRYEI